MPVCPVHIVVIPDNVCTSIAVHITVVTRFNVFTCPCQQVNHGSLSTTHAYSVTYPTIIAKVLVIRIIIVLVLVIVTKISLDHANAACHGKRVSAS